MPQAVVRIAALPGEAIDAAAEFHALHLERVRDAAGAGAASLVVVLPPAAADHSGWLRAVVQGLARAYAPVRVNFVSGGAETGLASALAWIERAPGVTGQLFRLD